jgi:L-amino acid N-acyltransferase YncA
VDILATTWGPDHLDDVWTVVEKEWAVFDPIALRVVASAVPNAKQLRLERDQHIIAGRLGALTSRPRPRNAERIRSASVSAEGAHGTVVAGYETLPESIRTLLAPATVEDLAECDEKGLLRTVCVDDAVAGVIAVAPRSEFGLEGFVVIEEILVAEFRGRGLAAGLQRAMIDAMAPNHGDAALFGTIDSGNVASVRTALRTGRTEVASYWWLFGGPPDAE